MSLNFSTPIFFLHLPPTPPESVPAGIMVIELPNQNTITEKNMVSISLVRAALINANHNKGQKNDPINSPNKTEKAGLKLSASFAGHHFGFGNLKMIQTPYIITTPPKITTAIFSQLLGASWIARVPIMKTTRPRVK